MFQAILNRPPLSVTLTTQHNCGWFVKTRTGHPSVYADPIMATPVCLVFSVDAPIVVPRTEHPKCVCMLQLYIIWQCGAPLACIQCHWLWVMYVGVGVMPRLVCALMDGSVASCHIKGIIIGNLFVQPHRPPRNTQYVPWQLKVDVTTHYKCDTNMSVQRTTPY